MPLRCQWDLTIGCSWGSWSREGAVWCDNYFLRKLESVGQPEAARGRMLLSSCQAGFGFQELEMVLLWLLGKDLQRTSATWKQACIPRHHDYITCCELHYYFHVILSVHYPFIISKFSDNFCINVHPCLCCAMGN